MATTTPSYTPRLFPVANQTTWPRYFSGEFSNISNAITALTQMLTGKLALGTYKAGSLPTGIQAGTLANVSDGAASLAWGATVTGGGTASYLVRYNGANWTVVGK